MKKTVNRTIRDEKIFIVTLDEAARKSCKWSMALSNSGEDETGVSCRKLWEKEIRLINDSAIYLGS